jgi:hypothetical protein
MDTARQRAAEAIADRINQCESTHQLHQARELRKTGEGGSYDRSTYDWLSCTWPPSRDSDADGFTRIHVDVLDGPGEGEASDSNVRDVITGPCATYEVTYDLTAMGDIQRGTPTRLARGMVTWIDHLGQQWSPNGSDGWTFYPGRDEVTVLRNDNFSPVSISCA